VGRDEVPVVALVPDHDHVTAHQAALRVCGSDEHESWPSADACSANDPRRPPGNENLASVHRNRQQTRQWQLTIKLRLLRTGPSLTGCAEQRKRLPLTPKYQMSVIPVGKARRVVEGSPVEARTVPAVSRTRHVASTRDGVAPRAENGERVQSSANDAELPHSRWGVSERDARHLSGRPGAGRESPTSSSDASRGAQPTDPHAQRLRPQSVLRGRDLPHWSGMSPERVGA
jgi:hypothetical protein